MTPRSLFIVRPTLDTGGADRVTLTLLQHLDRRRFSPTLVLMRRAGRLLPAVPEDVEVVSLDAANILTASRPLRRLIRVRRPDIVFSTSSGTNISASLATPRSGPRLVLSERSGLVREHGPLKRWALLALKRRLYGRAHCITAVCEGVARDVTRRLRVSDSRVKAVFNPVVTPELDDRASEAVDDPWLDGSTPVLLAAGRITRVKGFDLLLEALAEVNRHRECRLILLGEGPLRRWLEDRAKALGLSNSVRFPGFVTNPYAYMRRCTLFVLSSHFEGLPGVLIQAMACGAPVISTDCPFGPNEIVTPGTDGMLVPPGDAPSLARAILGLLDDEPRRLAMGGAGRRSAQRFTLENVMPHYIRALDPETA